MALHDRRHALVQLARARVVLRRQRAREDPADLLEVLLLQAARGQRRRADAQARGLHRRAGVERDRVAVHGDIDLREAVLGLPAAELGVAQIHQHQVHVGAAGQHAHAVARPQQLLGKRLRAGDRAPLALHEGIARGELEGHRLGGDHVLQRSSLLAREDCRVDLLGELLLAQDHPRARAAQRLVGRGRDDVSAERDRVGVQARRHQPGEVRHVDHQQRADLVGDLAEAAEVKLARVRGPPREQQLGAALARQPSQRVHVDQAAVAVHLVGRDVVQAPGYVDLLAVREVPTVVQRQPHDRVAGLEQRVIHGRVGLRAGMRLHIRVLGPEQRRGAVDRELLGDVHPLAAAVVAAPRIALRVLVGEHRALAFEHRGRGEVLRRDQVERAPLALELAVQHLGDLGVRLGQWPVQVIGAQLGHDASLGGR